MPRFFFFFFRAVRPCTRPAFALHSSCIRRAYPTLRLETTPLAECMFTPPRPSPPHREPPSVGLAVRVGGRVGAAPLHRLRLRGSSGRRRCRCRRRAAVLVPLPLPVRVVALAAPPVEVCVVLVGAAVALEARGVGAALKATRHVHRQQLARHLPRRVKKERRAKSTEN